MSQNPGFKIDLDMKLLERRILEFLMAHNGVYVNPHRVVVTLISDYSMHVSVGYPGRRFRGDVVVEYFYSCENVSRFIGKFGIGAFSDLGKIKAVEIQKLYSEGKGWVFCLVTEGCLIFQQGKKTMKVIDDDIGRAYEVSGLLNDSEEFINYTKTYYHEKYNKSEAVLSINFSPPHPPNSLSPAT